MKAVKTMVVGAVMAAGVIGGRAAYDTYEAKRERVYVVMKDVHNIYEMTSTQEAQDRAKSLALTEGREEPLTEENIKFHTMEIPQQGEWGGSWSFSCAPKQPSPGTPPPVTPPPGTPPGPPPPGSTQKIDWGVARVHSMDVKLDVSKLGRPVRICDTDTGIDKNHPDLTFVKGINFTTSDPTAFGDVARHGTHTAGLMAALDNLVGFVGAVGHMTVDLYIAKGLNDQGSGDAAGLAKAVVWCADQGVDFINASWGSPQFSQVIYNAFAYAASKGVESYVAMGNDNSQQPSYPAGYRINGLHAIAALDRNDARAVFSNYGSNAAMACPGVEVMSTVPGGYGVMSGTSMATPICLGVAAIFKAAGKPIKFDPLPQSAQIGVGIPNALGVN